jgi:Zn-dependent peptidase ImmA (M78 family)/transcriptional regulator with XRE-family HTH domain
MNATIDLCISQEAAKVGVVDPAAGIGARIRELRERAGIQSQALAASLGIDPSAMSHIERGKRAVKSSELATIASVLGVSPLAILSEGSLLAELPVAARTQDEGSSSRSALGRLTALAELHQVLTDQGIVSHSALEHADVPSVDLEDWLRSGELLAHWAREHLPAREPLPRDRFTDLANAIEHLGIDVMVDEYPPTEILGASITDRRFPFILVNSAQPISRALFTLAHELGHVLSGDGEQPLTLDVSLTPHTPREMFANVFAASLLMPESDVHAIIDANRLTSETLALMVTRFGVSYTSLVYRLHNLGRISATERDRLQARGWPAVLRDLNPDERRKALGRQGMRPERRPPALLTLRTLQGYQDGVVSVRPLAGLLNRDPDELLDQYVREQDSLEVWEVVNEREHAGEPSTTDEDLYSGVPA